MTLSDIDTRVSFYTGNTSDFTTANRLISLNTAIYDIETEILLNQDGWKFDDSNESDFPILTTSLVASQADYPLPVNYITISRAEISYDGTNWVKLNRTNVESNGHPTDAATIANDYSTSNPFYDIIGGSIVIYPTPSSAVSDGLKVWMQRLATAFTSAEYTGGTKSPGFDLQFHDMIPLKMSIDYSMARDMDRFNRLAAVWASYLERLKSFYSRRDSATVYSFTSSNKDYN